ncbi:MAG: cytochrome C oxidase subunit IV family protein [Phycisphaeraceae bacterium]|nr:cytochrome C oxidase subunit IV family protein [Phycisphaeraceae bacterium]
MANPSASHAHHHGAHGEAHPLVGHLVPMSTLLGTAAALIVLTVITVAVRYIDVGEFNIHIAIGIAVIKATLVALFFMHLRWDRPFNLLMFVACVLFVVLMMAFTVMDSVQYKNLQFGGNPPAVQKTLEAAAPGAPVARFHQFTP